MAKKAKEANVPNKGCPRLRFPEFEGEWEEKKLAEITIWSSGGTPPKDNPSFWNGDIPWISASSMRGLLYSDSELKITQAGLKEGSKLASKGTLLILVRGSMLFNKIPIGIASKDVAFNQDVKSIVVNDYSTSEYILYWFLASESKILNMVTGTGIGAGKLDLQDLKELKIEIPVLLEQQKIASFFSLINERIDTQSKIIERLESSIRILREKIFTQKFRLKDENGSDFPVWKTIKLGEIGELITGLTYSPDEISDDGILVLRSSNIQRRMLDFEDNVFVNVNNFNPVLEKDILICARNGSKNLIGKNAIIKKEHSGHAFGAFMIVYRSTHNEFLFQWFDTEQYKLEVHKNLGATINSINASDLKKFKVPLPSKSEQNKIADFLSAMDQRIQMETSILKQYQAQKKYLLQNMFI